MSRNSALGRKVGALVHQRGKMSQGVTTTHGGGGRRPRPWVGGTVGICVPPVLLSLPAVATLQDALATLRCCIPPILLCQGFGFGWARPTPGEMGPMGILNPYHIFPQTRTCHLGPGKLSLGGGRFPAWRIAPFFFCRNSTL